MPPPPITISTVAPPIRRQRRDRGAGHERSLAGSYRCAPPAPPLLRRSFLPRGSMRPTDVAPGLARQQGSPRRDNPGRAAGVAALLVVPCAARSRQPELTREPEPGESSHIREVAPGDPAYAGLRDADAPAGQD